MLLIVAISAAKLSVILLLIGIKPQASVVFASRVLIAIIVVWAFASLLALGLQCSLPRPWNFTPGRCINQVDRGFAVGVGAAMLILGSNCRLGCTTPSE